jgi:hypothetical protein
MAVISSPYCAISREGVERFTSTPSVRGWRAICHCTYLAMCSIGRHGAYFAVSEATPGSPTPLEPVKAGLLPVF